MSVYQWIDAKDYTMNCFLFFERWALRYILTEDQAWRPENGESYVSLMARALHPYPHVKAFCRHKCPESNSFLNKVEAIAMDGVTPDVMRKSEIDLLQMLETFVVYAYPQVMNSINYIRNWEEKHLHRLADFRDKVVLDVGAGTGRLAFAAAKVARRVYASEPCDMLREYMRDQIKARGIANMKVLDGEAACLPFEDDTFDVVTSGHVVGDDYDTELREMARITKDGGWIICCNGDDEFKRAGSDEELVRRGFEYFSHESVEGGIIYDYRKQVVKRERLFDLWAEDYDQSVAQSDKSSAYPFAGYQDTLDVIYRHLLNHSAQTVLDIGFGTGTLTSRLYQQGCRIFGQDFSEKMIALAQAKMPLAQFYCGDIGQGLHEKLAQRSYDAIVATYALHHLKDEEKIAFIRSLLPLLSENGCLCIGDVAFETREEWKKCRATCGDAWDEEEYYFIYDELKKAFPPCSFTKTSFCAGVMILKKRDLA